MGRLHDSLLVAGRGRTFLLVVASGAGFLRQGEGAMVCPFAGGYRCPVAHLGSSSPLVRPIDSGIIIRLPHGHTAGCVVDGLRSCSCSGRRLDSIRVYPSLQAVDVVAVRRRLCGGAVGISVPAITKLLAVRVGAFTTSSGGHGVWTENVRHGTARVRRHEMDWPTLL